MSAFFIALSYFYPSFVLALCEIKTYDELAVVKKVTDGDTIVLTDKRKIRLIGINSPEIGSHSKTPEAFALAAKHFVEAALKENKKVHLVLGRETHDRYGRVLAHVFLEDGRNLNAMLLENGLASAIAIPPNLNLNECYFSIEKNAHQQQKNIWLHPDFEYIDATKIPVNDIGYRFIKGKVIRVGRSRNALYLQLAKTMTLRIKRIDFKYFPTLHLEKLSLATLNNHMIYVRGWVYKRKNELYLQVRHRSMIQIK